MKSPITTYGSCKPELDVELGEIVLQILGVGGEEHERGEPGRADRIALGHRLGGVADGVERVGGAPHLARQIGHLGDTAGVVGDRAVGVERDDHAGERQHRRRRDRDAEQARRSDRTTMMPTQITMTGNAVASIDTARPWITLVPWPVVELSAMLRTGRYSVAV